MSNKSIGSKIKGLEDKLRAENELRDRDPPLLNNPTGHPRGAGPRRPKTMNSMPSRSRPRHMNIPSMPAPSHDIETENRWRELQKSKLTIDGQKYPSDIRDLEHLGELGNGTCGHVVKMLHKPSQAIIAVKQMRRSGNSEENKRILMDLYVVLRCHGCPYIVRCLGCVVTEADVWICMELMASCFDKILKRLGGPVPEDILGKVTVATVKALSYLKEEHGVMHRDVKPSNILVDARGCIKLCDFGISGRLVDSKAKTRSAGCAAYMAPERIEPPDPQKPDYDIRADVWSLGISLVELATGVFPYRDCQNDFEVLSKVISEDPPTLPDNQMFSQEIKLFVQQCLTKNYHNRPKYAALLQHPFIVRSEASGVRVDNWLARVLPPAQRMETPPIIRRNPNAGNTEESSVLQNNHKPPSSPQYNGPAQLISPEELARGSSTPQHEKRSLDLEHDSKSTLDCRNNESPISEHSRLQDSKKSSQESPDQSLSESSKASCISIEQNLAVRDSLGSRISALGDEGESGSFSSMNVEGDSTARDVSMTSVENLSLSKQIEDIESTRIQSPPLDRTKVQRNNTPSECFNPNGMNLNIVNRQHNYTPVLGNSPKEYYVQHRNRSLSNTMVQHGNNCIERNPPPRFVTGSPNTKNYFANLEIRNQPFSGGGPSSFDSYTSQMQNHDFIDYQAGGYQRFGSPECVRRQYFSPSRNRAPVHPGYTNEYTNQPREMHHNLVSVPNNMLGRDGYENVPESHFSPPCFRPNGPTNYFTSTAVCTMSRFGPAPMQHAGNVPIGSGYHQNPGGSCSQPASLEAYGETRHYSPYVHASRPPEKSYSPALWSPQPVARRSAREREDRWRGEAQHQHPQVPGNTSPIVLQRFYHQQGQRRSRRDLRDASPRQRSSLSREASVGRSPEPPRRAHRDPSSGRTDGPALPMDQQSLIERLEKERERMSADLNTPERESRQLSRDCEKPQPDLIRPHHRYERDPRYPQDIRGNDSPSSADRESIVNTAKERFELRTKNEVLNNRSHRERKDDLNGDYRSDRDDNSDRDNLCSPRERYERLQERKNNKEAYNHSRERRDEPNGDVHKGGKDDSSRLSPLAMHRHTKGHKDKDDQASGGDRRPSSPTVGQHTGKDGHSRVSRFGGIPRRIADCDVDGLAHDKRQQEYGHNFVPGLRYNAVPQPPPRRTAESWSLPGSPLPARPS